MLFSEMSCFRADPKKELPQNASLHVKPQEPMPLSARCFTTICVIQRIDPGIDPCVLGSVCVLRQALFYRITLSHIAGVHHIAMTVAKAMVGKAMRKMETPVAFMAVISPSAEMRL